MREKGLTVFSLYSSAHPATEVDLFVEAPLDFDEAFRGAVRMEVGQRTWAVFVGLDDPLRLKKRAGRPQDLQDIERHQAIRQDGSRE